jgi:hypothetical protein
MPDYRKSYKKSKSSKNSKSGGRRRKHTMRKYRRGRKVMRGGAQMWSVFSRVPEFFKPDLESAIRYVLPEYRSPAIIPEELSKTELLTKIKTSKMYLDNPEEVKKQFEQFYAESDYN